jgi:hypothetical protein
VVEVGVRDEQPLDGLGLRAQLAPGRGDESAVDDEGAGDARVADRGTGVERDRRPAARRQLLEAVVQSASFNELT